jgi:hypothetical protein
LSEGDGEDHCSLFVLILTGRQSSKALRLGPASERPISKNLAILSKMAYYLILAFLIFMDWDRE